MNKINWDEEIELTAIVGTDKAIYTGNKKLDSDQKKIKYEIMVQPKNFNLWVDEYGKMGGAITPYVRNKPKDEKEKEMKPYLFDLYDPKLDKRFRWSSLSTNDEGYNKHVAKILRDEADRLDPSPLVKGHPAMPYDCIIKVDPSSYTIKDSDQISIVETKKAYESDEIDWDRPIEFLWEPKNSEHSEWVEAKHLFACLEHESLGIFTHLIVYKEGKELWVELWVDKTGIHDGEKVVRNKGLL